MDFFLIVLMLLSLAYILYVMVCLFLWLLKVGLSWKSLPCEENINMVIIGIIFCCVLALAIAAGM
jgi:hypothetical protein